MSCPDWTRLAPGEAVPAALRAHADGCERCRPLALVHDPLLVFRRLPALEVGTDEVAAMQRAVAAMRRGHEVDERATGARRPVRGRIGRWSAVGRGGALRAAVLAAAVLGATGAFWLARDRAGGDAALRLASTDAAVSEAPLAVSTEAGVADAIEELPAVAAHPSLVPASARGPLIENVDGYEVIQMAYDDLDLVVVYDRSAEVSNLDV